MFTKVDAIKQNTSYIATKCPFKAYNKLFQQMKKKSRQHENPDKIETLLLWILRQTIAWDILQKL